MEKLVEMMKAGEVQICKIMWMDEGKKKHVIMPIPGSMEAFDSKFMRLEPGEVAINSYEQIGKKSTDIGVRVYEVLQPRYIRTDAIAHITLLNKNGSEYAELVKLYERVLEDKKTGVENAEVVSDVISLPNKEIILAR